MSRDTSSAGRLLEVIVWSFVWAIGTSVVFFVSAILAVPWLGDRMGLELAVIWSLTIALGGCGVGGFVSLVGQVPTAIRLPVWCQVAHVLLVLFAASVASVPILFGIEERVFVSLW